MRKILFILTSTIVVIIVFIVFAIFTNNKASRKDTTGPETTPSPSKEIPIPTGDKIIISDHEVNNFYKSANRIDKQNNVYMADEPDSYQILYEEQFNQFLISILGSPFEQVRQEAERRLISDLGISEDEACQFNVVITTPSFANPDFSGKPYGLSFCEQ